MNTAVGIMPARFAEGMTIAQFVEEMNKNKELFQQRYETFRLREEDEATLRELGQRLPIKAIVLAEDWCGDVLRYVPVFARMAEIAETWEVRVFCRDENLDLADQWLKQGQFRSIPVIVFFNERLEEFACFVEKPAVVYTDDMSGRETFAQRHSELPDAHLPIGEMSAETYNLYVAFIRKYREGNTARWQQMFVDEVLGKLRAAGGVEELVTGMTSENVHGETSTGYAVGKEIV